MNPGQFKDPLCYLCLCGTVVSSLSLMLEAMGSGTEILFIFELSLNLLNSMKTFWENSNKGPFTLSKNEYGTFRDIFTDRNLLPCSGVYPSPHV